MSDEEQALLALADAIKWQYEKSHSALVYTYGYIEGEEVDIWHILDYSSGKMEKPNILLRVNPMHTLARRMVTPCCFLTVQEAKASALRHSIEWGLV